MGDPMSLPFGSTAGLELNYVLPTGRAEDVARQVLKCVAAVLVRKGELPPREAPSLPAGRGSRGGSFRSVRPSRAPAASRVAAPPAQEPWAPSGDLAIETSSASFQAVQFPAPPLVPGIASHGVGSVSARSTVSLSNPTLPATGPRSLMPRAVPIEGSRWLLLDDDVARAHTVATCLTNAGASVELSGLEPTDARLRALRDFDGSGVLVPAADLRAFARLHGAFETDARLRWVPLVSVRYAGLFDEARSSVDQEALKLLLLPHWQPVHDLIELLFDGQHVDLARIGPAKLLRAAARSQAPVDLDIEANGVVWSLRLAEGELFAVYYDGRQCGPEQCGPVLDALLHLEQGWARLASTNQVCSDRRLGPVAAILRAHAFHGVPQITVERLPLRLQFRARTEDLIRRARALSVGAAPLARSASVQFARLGPAQKNGLALAAGIACTAAIVALLFALQGSPPLGAAVDSGQVAGGGRDAEKSAALSAPEHPQNAAVAPVVVAAPVAEEPQTVVAAKTAGERAARNADGTPQGCARWNSGKTPVVPQPHQAAAAVRMAQKSLQAGNLAKAEELFCLSVAMDPSGPGAAGLVRYHFAQNNIDAATQWAEWSATQQPKDPEVKQLLADARHRQGRIDEARALLHDAMNVSAADVKVLRQVARKYALSGYAALKSLDAGQAERLFRRAVTLDGKNVLALAGLSDVSLRNGDVNAAMHHAAFAVKLNPRSYEGQLALGDAHAESGDQSAAKQAWLEAARLRPLSRDARRRLGL
jgi:tetratricopeptide (TPR) repeat protein